MIVDLLAQATGEVHLTTAGAVIMLASVVLVCGLNVFCLARILRGDKPADKD